MRCRQCAYPLWNLTARACPECGAPFRPGAYEFAANSVRFCCPGCGQAYYGTGERGHLVPREFDCVKCGQHVDMDQMVLRLAEGVEESQTSHVEMPWLERRQRGRVRAWFATLGMSMTAPHRLIRAAPEDSPTWQAWLFAAITWTLFMAISFGGFFCVIAFILAVSGESEWWESVFAGLVSTAGAAGAGLLWLALWGFTTHGLLRITGGCAFPMRRTWHALCYSTGAAVTLALPVLGWYCGFIGLIWPIVAAVIMVAVGQRVHGGRAAFAVLALPAATVLAVVVAYFGLIAWLFTRMPSMTGQSEVQPVVTALRAVALARPDGQGPAHALSLAVDGAIDPAFFILMDTATSEADVPVGDVTLEEWIMMEPGRQQVEVTTTIDRLPAGVIAHRVGDFVFTHHGIDVRSADRRLWLLLATPDPDVNPNGGRGLIQVGQADGTVHSLAPPHFNAALNAQNALRRSAGLAPLPDPRTITHANPATAGP